MTTETNRRAIVQMVLGMFSLSAAGCLSLEKNDKAGVGGATIKAREQSEFPPEAEVISVTEERFDEAPELREAVERALHQTSVVINVDSERRSVIKQVLTDLPVYSPQEESEYPSGFYLRNNNGVAVVQFFEYN